jgi:nucleoside-diphosphate-sugar epimerase
MRVFVTGATGWVGLAVVQELLATGHSVIGLVRSEESASSLRRQHSVEAVIGSLDDLDLLRQSAQKLTP